MKITKILQVVTVALGLVSATVSVIAQDKVYTFRHLDAGAPIRLELPQFKVRVDGWDKNYVQVRVCLTAKSHIQVKADGNLVGIRIERFKAPLWEPGIRVSVPREQAIVITGGNDVWMKDCTVDRIKAKRAYVRDCQLLHPTTTITTWAGKWGRGEGWKAVACGR